MDPTTRADMDGGDRIASSSSLGSFLRRMSFGRGLVSGDKDLGAGIVSSGGDMEDDEGVSSSQGETSLGITTRNAHASFAAHLRNTGKREHGDGVSETNVLLDYEEALDVEAAPAQQPSAEPPRPGPIGRSFSHSQSSHSLRRAGLLRPRSPSSAQPHEGPHHHGHLSEAVAHSQKSIRLNTVQLSYMLLSPLAGSTYGSLPAHSPRRLDVPRPLSTSTSASALIFPTPDTTLPPDSSFSAVPPPSRPLRSTAPTPVSPSTHAMASPDQHGTLQPAEIMPAKSTSPSPSMPASTFTQPTYGPAYENVPERPHERDGSVSTSPSSLDFSTTTEESSDRRPISYPSSSFRSHRGFPSTLSFFDSDGSDHEEDNGTGEDIGRTPTQHRISLPQPGPPSPPPPQQQGSHTRSHSQTPSGLSLLLRSHSAEREGREEEAPTADGERAMGGVGSQERGGDAKFNIHLKDAATTTTTTPPAITLSVPSNSAAPISDYGSFPTSGGIGRLPNEMLAGESGTRPVQRYVNADERVPLLPSSQASPPKNAATSNLVSSYHSVTRLSPYSQSQPQSHSISSSPPSNSNSSSSPFQRMTSFVSNGVSRGVKEVGKEENWKLGVKALPSVLLGCLLNILDGVSYGMIIFPSSPPFSTHQASTLGVSMFFVSCFIAQMVYTMGGSGFKGANGSMMIEVVPFFHIMATSIAEGIGEDRPSEVIATTLVAYALSSVLTGLAFFLLGALRLGVIIGFFPRHILVGCIGGVGVFLFLTGLTVSTRLPDDDFAFDLETFKFFFMNEHNLVMWLIPLALAVLLRIITSRWRGDMVFPAYFLIIPVLFYTVVSAAGLDLHALRKAGWLFDVGTGGTGMKWYEFYTYFDYKLVHFAPLWNTLPTQFALLFFNILHPPLNVPALSVSLNEDIDTNKELVGHGYSNLLSGLFGTVPNYLVYVNTLLFYRVGGNTRIAGFLLAIATLILLFTGTGPIAFIPVMVVGALIFVLGLDLVKEALWDARHRASRTEYITIISIMVCMTAWDFVIGVLFGIIMSCVFFVVQNSQVPSIRALRNGETAMSSVRRPSSQRDYLREVSKQTTVMHLQGFLFFGTIVSVEECIRELIEGASWQRNPVRFLVLDLSLVAGVDMSAAEAFVRVHRLVATKHVILVFCGFDQKSEIGKALETVEVLGADGVEFFETLNDALEWTENAYLRAWFRSHKTEISTSALPGRREADVLIAQSFGTSPRFSHLHDAGNRTIAKAQDVQPRFADDVNVHTEPFQALVKAFSSYGEISFEQFRPMLSYLRRISVPEGRVLWKQNDHPDGIYIIESGVLRARYDFADYAPTLEESMVAGTLAGELSALSDSPRNATVVAERPSVLWQLSVQDLRRLERDHPALFWNFCRLVLKVAKVDYDILLSSVASRT